MTVLWIIIRATAIFGLAAAIDRLLRRRASAAARHFVWTLAICGVLVVPAASLLLPEWTVVVPMTSSVSTTTTAARSSVVSLDESVETPLQSAATVADVEPAPAAPRTAAFPWALVVLTIYMCAALGMMIHVLAGQATLRRFVRRAADVSDPDWIRLLAECANRMNVRRSVRLLQSREENVPAALGTIRPAIVVPAVADTWERERQRAVLLHEMAHVARYDCLTQMLALAACALYWFHPAMWYAARRLRVERELACDDKVIACGTDGRDYAGHLLEIAYSVGGDRAPALAVGMARRTQLEGRMLAAIDGSRNRSVPRRRVRLACAAIAAVMLVAIAAVKTTTTAAAEQTGHMSTVRSVNTLKPAARAARTYARSTTRSLRATARSFTRSLRQSTRRLMRSVVTTFGIAQAPAPGTWEIRPSNVEGTVHLRLVDRNSSHGTSIRIDQLQGLTAAQLSGAGGPVHFQLRRDAGTFSFEGIIRNGVGAGAFSFTPDPSFADGMAKRGFARPSAADQYEFARADVGYGFVDELNRQGYTKPHIDDLVRAAEHGVHFTYLQEMGALGYRLGTLESLIVLRDHGVSPSYIRDLVQQGYKGLTADELRTARDHGVGPEYVGAMREAGYGGLPMAALINARDHGVSAEYIRGLRETGYGKLSLDEVIRARDHGVSLEYVREMGSLGYAKLPMDELRRLRDHGVSVEYVRAIKALGYDRLSPDDLVTLRDHGLSAERIRAANARAGSRLPVDLLKSLR
jgi:beta-lactamase regulating signal transducer with metallopeptidase domain